MGEGRHAHRVVILSATGPKKFTEPVALSSPEPVGFPLSRTALGPGFDLLALRSRCKGDSTTRRRPVQGDRNRNVRSLHAFYYPHANRAIHAACSREAGPKKFADPVALSSPEPTDLPLARTASRLGFDLLALRGRRKRQSIPLRHDDSRPPKSKSAQFAGGRYESSSNRLSWRPAGASSRAFSEFHGVVGSAATRTSFEGIRPGKRKEKRRRVFSMVWVFA